MVCAIKPRCSSDGFSLIEMLVVIAVTSVLAIGATLTLGTRPRASGAFAFSEDAHALRRLAMVSGTRHSLVRTSTGWRAERLSGKNKWEPVRGWGRSARIAGMQDPAGHDIVRVVFHADGTIDDAVVRFVQDRISARCTVAQGALPACTVD
ncbi:MAG: type II secretion system protein [Marinibacterium sp.]